MLCQLKTFLIYAGTPGGAPVGGAGGSLVGGAGGAPVGLPNRTPLDPGKH